MKRKEKKFVVKMLGEHRVKWERRKGQAEREEQRTEKWE